ncbi:MAG: triose-phosphate isomerase [Bacteroidetes bacterium]|nr:triose-phosphate isomerase [Bacteroidota bacterium]
MKRRKIVAGNWKMNNDLNEALGLVTEIKGIVKDEVRNDAEIILFPPYISLASIAKNIEKHPILLGAQNVHQENVGAYTGEISVSMLKSVGCSYVIIGHSERRQYFSEDNELLNLKIKRAISGGLVPIYCIGETLEERENGDFWDVLKTQLWEGLEGISAEIAPEKMVIAYEPVWAIGTGKTASTEQAQDVHSYIREELAEIFSPETAAQIRILYGGSVKPDNAKELFSAPDIDGGLIGGASLKSRDFCEIIKAVG